MALRSWFRRKRGWVPRALPQKPARPGAPIILGGRVFRPIGESTVEHDLKFMALLRDLGLDDPHRPESEAPEQFAVRLLNDLISSGRALEALGYLLIPGEARSEDWTPALGEETAEFLGGLVDPKDKARVQGLTLSFLRDFFELGLGSWALSTSSSAKATSASPQESQTTATASGERWSAD